MRIYCLPPLRAGVCNCLPGWAKPTGGLEPIPTACTQHWAAPAPGMTSWWLKGRLCFCRRKRTHPTRPVPGWWAGSAHIFLPLPPALPVTLHTLQHAVHVARLPFPPSSLPFLGHYRFIPGRRRHLHLPRACGFPLPLPYHSFRDGTTTRTRCGCRAALP